MQETKQKKKLKKTRKQVIEEFRSVLNKTKAVFVRELCEAIRDENPIWEGREDLDDGAKDDIRQMVYSDCEELGLNKGTVTGYLSSWLQYDSMIRGSIKGWEKRNAQALEKTKKNLELSKQISLPNPPEPKQIEEKYTPLDDEEHDKELHSLQMDKFGTTGKSIRELYGDITHYANGLFKTMTEKEMPYADNEDLIVDYIKPSREYWRSLMLEFDETKRTRTHNELSFLAELIEDRLQIINEVKDK